MPLPCLREHSCAFLSFENNFYQARQKGLVAEEDITQLMLAAQKKSYKR